MTLQDNTSFKAELVGRDTKIDVALLRIKAPKPLPAVKFGDSDKTRIGDWVLAIGNPFGLGGTVTAGILSARAREINAGPYDDFLQTDAAINRGNSGGPMFNMDGDVIGINTAIYSPSGGSIGIGFSLPSNLARPVLEQIRDFGHARRGWLGINIQSVTDEIAESLGLDKPRGALIASVKEGGPAQVAGIEPGDVVLEFDGKEVTDMRHLPRVVAETPIDTTVKVKLWRKRKEMTVDVKVGELKEEPTMHRRAKAGSAAGQRRLVIDPRPLARRCLARPARAVRARREHGRRRRYQRRCQEPGGREGHARRRRDRRGGAGRSKERKPDRRPCRCRQDRRPQIRPAAGRPPGRSALRGAAARSKLIRVPTGNTDRF